MMPKSSRSRAFTTVLSARREIVRDSISGEVPGTLTRGSAPSAAARLAEASRVLSSSAWAWVVWKAWAMSFVTWSPPTPMTPTWAR